MSRRTLVLGLGNTLLADEGIGVHALVHLRECIADRAPELEPDLVLLDGGTLSFTLASAIEDNAQLIVIDASRLEATPGTVRVFEGKAMDHFLGTGKRASVHEVSLLDLLAVAALTGNLPPRRALIGVEPEAIDWSDTPTPTVQASIPRICDQVLELARRWAIDPVPTPASTVGARP